MIIITGLHYRLKSWVTCSKTFYAVSSTSSAIIIIYFYARRKLCLKERLQSLLFLWRQKNAYMKCTHVFSPFKTTSCEPHKTFITWEKMKSEKSSDEEFLLYFGYMYLTMLTLCLNSVCTKYMSPDGFNPPSFLSVLNPTFRLISFHFRQKHF